MNSRSVLISGAGIAGPSLAYWLHQYGFDVTVVESARAPRPGGQAVDLRGVARDVIERMGLMPRAQCFNLEERGIAFLDRGGRTVSTMPVDAFGGEGIVAQLEILRSDLSQILLEATTGSIEYVFGDRITAITQQKDRVDVTFGNGRTRDYDFVVGADGAYSNVRSLAFGPHAEFARPLGGYTAYFSVPDPGDIDGWFLMYNTPGGRVVGLRPVRDGMAQAMLTFRSAQTLDEHLSAHAQKQILAEKFAGVGWHVPAVLEGMWQASDFYFGPICQVFIDRWWRDRVVLLGDAAYCPSPLTGLGTSMALVGAYVLAGELASSVDDPESSFSRYQEAMRAYVAECQTLPPGGLNGYAPNSAVMIAVRNLSMRMMTAWPLRDVLAKQFHKADAIALRNYPIEHANVRAA